MKSALSVWGVLFCLLVPGLAWSQLTPVQHDQLVEQGRWLAAKRLGYSQSWRPPDADERWVMDCSNTSRYLYRHVFGLVLPRTASDQYYELWKQGLITEAPLTGTGAVDTAALLEKMRSGDLLFWEWTYDIERTPPITHVMIYLGRTDNGTPKMVGSGCSGWGERTRRGGVDVYPFDPNASMGGVKNFLGHYVKKARFVGFGRPIQECRDGVVAQKAAFPLVRNEQSNTSG